MPSACGSLGSLIPDPQVRLLGGGVEERSGTGWRDPQCTCSPVLPGGRGASGWRWGSWVRLRKPLHLSSGSRPQTSFPSGSPVLALLPAFHSQDGVPTLDPSQLTANPPPLLSASGCLPGRGFRRSVSWLYPPTPRGQEEFFLQLLEMQRISWLGGSLLLRAQHPQQGLHRPWVWKP